MLPAWVSAVEASPIAALVRSRVWVFPVIESTHLVALAILAGSVLVVDLRVLGRGIVALPPAALARAVRPWFQGSVIVLIASGLLLWASEAARCYASPPFWAKIALLIAAVTFAATVHRRVVEVDDGASARAGVVSLVSIALWAAVAIAGRAISFY